MHAVTVINKKPLVIARSRNRTFAKRQTYRNALGVARMLDTDDPGATLAITDDTTVTAGTYHGLGDATLADNIGSAIDGVTLGDATEVDTHRVVAKLNFISGNHNMMIVDSWQFLRDRFVAGLQAFTVIVGIADAGISDIERSVRDLGEVNRFFDQMHHFIADFDRVGRGVVVDE